MVSKLSSTEPTLSIRYLWPFVDVIGRDGRALGLLTELGLTPADLADGEGRIPCKLAMHGIARAVEIFGDPLVGLQAGQRLGGDVLDVVERAACATDNLGNAIQVLARYIHIMNEGLLMSLSVDGDRAYTSFMWKIPHPPAANDIVIASALAFSKRVCVAYEAPLEVRMQHEAPTYAAAYERLLGVPVRFGATSNLIVMRTSRLQATLRRSSPSLAAAFESKVQTLDRSHGQAPDLTARVRQTVMVQLASGSTRMTHTAHRLGMSVATLRRKLEDEGTCFATIVEDLQRDAAVRYLSAPQPTVSEVAFLLGFADVRSFARAFRRWTGVAPTEFRKSPKESRGAPSNPT